VSSFDVIKEKKKNNEKISIQDFKEAIRLQLVEKSQSPLNTLNAKSNKLSEVELSWVRAFASDENLNYNLIKGRFLKSILDEVEEYRELVEILFDTGETNETSD
jgi:hypothetical protein